MTSAQFFSGFLSNSKLEHKRIERYDYYRIDARRIVDVTASHTPILVSEIMDLVTFLSGIHHIKSDFDGASESPSVFFNLA